MSKITFRIRFEHFEVVMPFGHTSAQAIFMDLINLVL